jgi:flagellar L-ring protein FlgH
MLLLSGCAMRGWLPTPRPKLTKPSIPIETKPDTMQVQAFELEREDRIKRTNSLWIPGSTSFLSPTKGFKTGDIITVVLKVQDKASFEGNSTNSTNSLNENPVLEFIGKILDVVSDLKTSETLGKIRRSCKNSGTSNTNRKELLNSSFAVTVKRVLHNGNLLICGSQEIIVNYEKRRMYLSGIIRPRDVSSNNSVESDKIAEARIYYGGSGAVH